MATAAPRRRRKHWGWGYEDEQPTYDEVRAAAAAMAPVLGFGDSEPERPVPLEEVALTEPRIEPPTELAEVCATDTYERAAHAYGKSYRDVVRAFRGRFDHPPDAVAHPRDEVDLEAVLGWCQSANAAVIPFGGGTSVVGGVEARVGDGYDGAVAIDLHVMVGRKFELERCDGARRPAQLEADTTELRHAPRRPVKLQGALALATHVLSSGPCLPVSHFSSRGKLRCSSRFWSVFRPWPLRSRQRGRKSRNMRRSRWNVRRKIICWCGHLLTAERPG